LNEFIQYTDLKMYKYSHIFAYDHDTGRR